MHCPRQGVCNCSAPAGATERPKEMPMQERCVIQSDSGGVEPFYCRTSQVANLLPPFPAFPPPHTPTHRSQKPETGVSQLGRGKGEKDHSLVLEHEGRRWGRSLTSESRFGCWLERRVAFLNWDNGWQRIMTQGLFKTSLVLKQTKIEGLIRNETLMLQCG